ncbi:MAG: DUF11 domain-containing protein [Chloroflexi bacterium]|nr:DUF11 domain-containing protein [Chloroflexota bacterium]
MTDTQKRQDLFTCGLAVVSLLLGLVLYQRTPPSLSQSAAALPVYAVNYHLTLPNPVQGGGSNPENPWAFIRQTGPSYAQPGDTASYALTLANYEAMTRTFTLTDTLPAALTFVPSSNRELHYNPATRQLTWQGEIAPGHLDYLIEPSSLSIPYIDLADFGAPNLCDELIATQGNCDEATVTLNLGVNGYSYPFYGQTWQSITLSPDGLFLAGAAAPGTLGDEGFEQESYPGSLFQPLSDVTLSTSTSWRSFRQACTLSLNRSATGSPTAPTSQNQWLPNPNPPGALIASPGTTPT